MLTQTRAHLKFAWADVQRNVGQYVWTKATAQMLLQDGEEGIGKSQLAEVIQGLVDKENQ